MTNAFATIFHEAFAPCTPFVEKHFFYDPESKGEKNALF
jgi:hypothetical protein